MGDLSTKSNGLPLLSLPAFYKDMARTVATSYIKPPQVAKKRRSKPMRRQKKPAMPTSKKLTTWLVKELVDERTVDGVKEVRLQWEDTWLDAKAVKRMYWDLVAENYKELPWYVSLSVQPMRTIFRPPRPAPHREVKTFYEEPDVEGTRPFETMDIYDLYVAKAEMREKRQMLSTAARPGIEEVVTTVVEDQSGTVIVQPEFMETETEGVARVLNTREALPQNKEHTEDEIGFSKWDFQDSEGLIITDEQNEDEALEKPRADPGDDDQRFSPMDVYERVYEEDVPIVAANEPDYIDDSLLQLSAAERKTLPFEIPDDCRYLSQMYNQPGRIRDLRDIGYRELPCSYGESEEDEDEQEFARPFPFGFVLMDVDQPENVQVKSSEDEEPAHKKSYEQYLEDQRAILFNSQQPVQRTKQRTKKEQVKKKLQRVKPLLTMDDGKDSEDEEVPVLCRIYRCNLPTPYHNRHHEFVQLVDEYLETLRQRFLSGEFDVS